MDCLVGYTGFVGSNLALKHSFSELYNSKNIQSAFQLKPDLCVYAGIPAEKFLANKDPEQDHEIVDQAIRNVQAINPRKLVVISTIDVYKNPVNVDENSEIDTNGLHPYGANRLRFEKWSMENIEHCTIIRLPALFGKGIKKNFIYDLIHMIPSLLNEAKYQELSRQSALIAKHYQLLPNGFYQCTALTTEERTRLVNELNTLGFSALHFTDSRAYFPFYHLDTLWKHIQIALEQGLRLINLAVQPLTAAEIVHAVHGKVFRNEIQMQYPRYDFQSIHSALFGGENGYLYTKEKVMSEIKSFASDYQR